jgi:hypothetical protein
LPQEGAPHPPLVAEATARHDDAKRRVTLLDSFARGLYADHLHRLSRRQTRTRNEGQRERPQTHADISARTSASRWSATQANKELSGPAASEICPESTNALVLLDQSKGQVQCCGDAFSLAFLPQVGFELSEYAKHVEEGLAGRGTHIVRLLGGDG